MKVLLMYSFNSSSDISPDYSSDFCSNFFSFVLDSLSLYGKFLLLKALIISFLTCHNLLADSKTLSFSFFVCVFLGL